MTAYNDKSLHRSTDDLAVNVNHGLLSVAWGSGIVDPVGIARDSDHRGLSKVLGSVTQQLLDGAELARMPLNKSPRPVKALHKGPVSRLPASKRQVSSLEEISSMTKRMPTRATRPVCCRLKPNPLPTRATMP